MRDMFKMMDSVRVNPQGKRWTRDDAYDDYDIGTRKFKVDPLVAKESLAAFDAHEIVVISPSLIHGAIECQVVGRISFRDALMVVAAEAGQCSTIYTEDLNSGRKIRGMKVENPFG
jgi:predicted nucleic acid-binding protein